MLSEFPSKPGDEPVTRDVLRAELGDLRAEMHQEFKKVYVWGTSALLGGLFGGLTVGMALAAAIARGAT